MIYKNILELIGNTPVIKLSKLENKYNIKNSLFAKLEKQNPAGSSKDRIAYNIIKGLLKNNTIYKDTVLIEATSGNTGIALAMVCAYLDLKLIIVMCESVSIERVKLLEAYGVKVILTNKEEGIMGAINKAKSLNKEIPNSFYINQFSNLLNVDAHYNTTAIEILKDFNYDIDYIFVGMGSGGTIMGIASKLKECINAKIIGIEPSGCPYYSKEEVGNYFIPGLGTTFMPDIVKLELIDDIETVDDKVVKAGIYELMKEEGISAGYSSGAVLMGALNYLKTNKIYNKKILLILPDSLDKYLSLL